MNDRQSEKPASALNIELYEKYSKSKLLKPIVSKMPILGIVDAVAVQQYAEIKKRNDRIFFEELSKGKRVYDEELIQSNEFVFAFAATYESALKTYNEQKIRMLASLLKGAAEYNMDANVFSFEYLLDIIKAIDVKEWKALLILEEYSKIPRNEDENRLQWSQRFWKEFKEKVKIELGIEEEEFTPFMNRIARTGLYVEITGTYLSYSGGIGYLTKIFYKIREIIERAA